MKCRIDMFKKDDMLYFIEHQRPNLKIITDQALEKIKLYPGNHSKLYKNNKKTLIENDDYWINNVEGRWGNTKDIGYVTKTNSKDNVQSKCRFITEKCLDKIVAIVTPRQIKKKDGQEKINKLLELKAKLKSL